MRNLFLALIAACAAMISVPASAQSVGEILSTVGNLQYDNCRYYDGLARRTCQVERISRIANTVRGNSSQSGYQQTAEFERRVAMMSALERACNAGDQHSCTRIGGSVDQSRIEMARALMDACRNGDRFSCDRADTVLASASARQRVTPTRHTTTPTPETRSALPMRVTRNQVRQSSNAQPQRVSQTQVLFQGCLVDVDPQTEMRKSGPYDCR